MRDWRSYVRERLTELDERGAIEEDVVRELADHLEDAYAEWRASGMSQPQALGRARMLVGNGRELRRQIQAADREDSMNDRTRQLWIPALVTLTLANVALALLLRANVPLAFVRAGSYASLCVYVPWLMMLPMVGAAGSFLARRSAARGWRVYFAALFPAAVLGGLFLLVLGFVSIFDRNAARHIQLGGVLLGVAGWVLLPAIALVIGVALQGLLSHWTKVSHA